METQIQKHYTKVRNVLVIVLFLNWGVAIAKIIYGTISHLASMTADGFHSLSDGTSNIIGLVGIHFACQPKDSDHPYGHKKYETFFSLGIAMLLFMLAFNLIKEAIIRIKNPIVPKINALNFIIMVTTIAVNFIVMHYEKKRGKALNSDILISDAMHTKADIFTSFSVIITMVVIGLGYPIFDPIATIIIALFIIHAGYEIVKYSSSILCDTVAIIDTDKITQIVLSIKGVKACHKIRSRGRPDDIHLDLHVQVNPDMHVDNAHKISYAIEDTLKKSIPELTDVIVHIEPKES